MLPRREVEVQEVLSLEQLGAARLLALNRGRELERIRRAAVDGVDLGLSKNIVDITCVTITSVLSMTVSHRILGVGIGTLIAMIGIGRVIAFVNKLSGEKLALLLQEEEPQHG